MSWIEHDTLKIMITYFENVTTHTVHLDLPQKKGRVTDFELIQVQDGQIEVRAPKTVCVRGHQVSVMLQAFSSSDTYPLKSRAKVLTLEPDEDGFVSFTLELHNKNDVDYQRFYEALKKRQEQVIQLFRAVKGDE